MPDPFVRESGAGPAMVCLHSNAASSSQWRELMDLLAPHYRVLAPDGYGAGKSPAWPTDRRMRLADEVALIEPVLARAGASYALVGHSYGGAVALKAALMHPERVSALALYEPTLFALVAAHGPSATDVDGIRDAVARSVAALAAGDEDGAARHFIDFWMGEGAWAATPPQRRPAIAAAVRNVQGWGEVLFGESTPLADFAALEMPALYMTGASSPLSAHAVARVLQPVLPRCECVEFAGLGHMGPLTHAREVNERIASFLRSVVP